jgi:thiamine-monophosphate kinase
LIARVRRNVGRFAGTRGLVTGIGDDCAVLRIPAGHETLVTTDFSLEGIHFRRDWHPPGVVGHRCLTRGLSDIAAMGGEPVAAFLSLALPAKLPQKWVDGFLEGFLELGRKFGVPLAGGDTAESPSGILADIVVIGSVPRGKAILRSGARVGDLIYVSGELGASAAVIDGLRRKPGKKLRAVDFSRHFYPRPRIELGRVLREKRLATAMIDISDGLSTDLAHLCEESGVGAQVEREAIPCARIGEAEHNVQLNFALHGGDDYELLFTARPGKRVPAQIAGVVITQIGRVTRGKKVVLIENGTRFELEPRGWEHFQP